MTTACVETHRAASVSLRDARGFHLRAAQLRRPDGVAFVHAHQPTGPSRAHMARAGAGQAAAPSGPSGAARRLRMARGGAPLPPGLGTRDRGASPRPAPSPTTVTPLPLHPPQRTARGEAAHASRPPGAWRPDTCASGLGLLARTALRVGDARRLQRDEATRARDPPPCPILATQVRPSRLVPLHARTAARRRHDHPRRAQWHDAGCSAALCGSAPGPPWPSPAMPDWCARLCQRLASAPTAGGRQPCLRSFRPTVAVTRLRRGDQPGLAGHAWRPHLSVYRGPVHPQARYGDLTAVPELLRAAAHRCQTSAHAGGARSASPLHGTPGAGLLGG